MGDMIWPAMRRVVEDRRTWFENGMVFHEESDHESLVLKASRSVTYPLCCYTVPLHQPDREMALLVSPYVPGRHPAAGDGVLVGDALLSLHAETPRRRATDEEVRWFYCDRVLGRLERWAPECLEEITAWYHKTALPLCAWGTWHGDPTYTNIIITPGGRVVLIDHAAQREGIIEYDLAKWNRHMILHDDGWHDTVEARRRYAGDVHMAVVLAGMVGSHPEPLRSALMELWRAVT